MWPFATRGSRFIGDAAAHHPSRLDPADFARNDAVIKLWLPAPLLAAIDVLCDAHDASRPDVLRWILFEHAFGRTEFTHLCRRMPEADPRRSTMSRPQAARRHPSGAAPATARAVNQHFLGKSSEDVKVALPAALKRELETLAESSGQPLSDYLRGVLVRELLGEGHYQRWQAELARVHRENGTQAQG